MSDLRVFFISKQGNDTNDGQSAAAPVATVAKGVELATAAGGGEVRVTTGRFDETPIELSSGVTISGGWDPTFTDAKRKLFTNSQLREIKAGDDLSIDHTCVTTSKGDRVFSIKSGKSAAACVLSQLVVIGPDLTTVTDSSSYGVIVDEAAATLDFVVIHAGKGGPGQTGKPGEEGVGLGTNGGYGGVATLIECKPNRPFGTLPSIPIFRYMFDGGGGGQGDSVILSGITVAKGGAGGARGETPSEPIIAGAKLEDCEDGHPGGNGNDGVQGDHGDAAQPGYGFFARLNGALQWVCSQGGQGGAGLPGAGGGGGGAGGSFYYYYFLKGNCAVSGGRGSWGGGGGAPGGGGYGGHSGGGAFGLLINNSTVTSAGFVLMGGEGGRGGNGGPGGKGASGETGSDRRERGTSTGMKPVHFGGYGAKGGDGGKGGGGGGGAGGNGGPVIHIVLLGEGSLKETGVLRHSDGGHSAGGMGGLGGEDQNRASAGHGIAPATRMKLELR